MTAVARVCRVCRSAFTYDPERFRGFRPPGLCRECHAERRRRLVPVQGTVIRSGDVGATIEAGTERFFWRLAGAGAEPRRPAVGDRVEFQRDPLEVAERGRLPLARLPRVVEVR